MSANGSSVMCDPDIDNPDRHENRTKLIVNYLPQGLTDEQLYAIFSTVGPVVSAKVIRDLKTNYSFGYGFVEYSTQEEAEQAIRTLKGYQIQNKRLGVAFARSHNKESLKNTNLYVSSIPHDMTSEEVLKDIFSKYGTIITIKLLRDERTGQPRGTAFVRFDRKEEAEEAIRELNGVQLPGAAEPLVVKVSEEHGKQKANQYAQYYSMFAGGSYYGNYDQYNYQQSHRGRGGSHPRGGRHDAGGQEDEFGGHFEERPRGRGGFRGRSRGRRGWHY